MVDRVNRAGGKEGVGAAERSEARREDGADRSGRAAGPAGVAWRPEAGEAPGRRSGPLIAALLAYAAPKAVDRRLLEPELLCGELETVLERLEAAPAHDDIAHVAKLAVREELDRLRALFAARDAATGRTRLTAERREGAEKR